MKYIMTDEALENYGEKYRDVVLIPVHKATKYMPAKQFFAQGKPEGYHPGYDEGLKGTPLFDMKREDTGELLNFSLYRWELEKA